MSAAPEPELELKLEEAPVPEPEPMVSVRGLKKYYGDTHAVRELSFDVMS